MTPSEVQTLGYATPRYVPLLTSQQARRIYRWCLYILGAWFALTAISSFFAKLMLSMLICVFAAPLAGVAIIVALIVWGKWMDSSRRWSQVLLVLVWPIVCGSIMSTNWPMRLSFAMSRSTLDRWADQIAVGTNPQTPFHAGVYTIRSVESITTPKGSIVSLWTDGKNHVGFVRAQNNVTPKVNPYTHTRLSATWHHFAED